MPVLRLTYQLALAMGLVLPACGGSKSTAKNCGEAGCLDGPSPGQTCRDIQVEGELEAGWLPRRPFWADSAGLHLAYMDRDEGVVWQGLSRETGQTLSRNANQPFPSTIDPALCGIEAVAANPQGDLAVALAYKDADDVEQDRFLFWSGGAASVWAPPWQGKYYTMGLGWDGETFTASLMSSDGRWAAARLSPLPGGSGDAELFGHASANYGYLDSETDAQDGTTVFVGASMPGIAVAGRRGRDRPLTPAEGWHFSSSGSGSGWATAVAVSVPTALVTWAEKDIMIGEVSLDSGEVLQAWTLPRDPGDNVFEQVAAARVNDRWVIVAQDYRGLVMAEIRNGELSHRRLLHHPPAACAENDSCGMSSAWRWHGSRLAVVKDGDGAWAGVLDMSRQRVEDHKALFTYRMLSVASACSYQSLGP